MSDPVIKFENVTYSAGGRTVLRNFSLEAQAGETVALLGRSGSGKTTALRMVNGMIAPSSGTVAVMGKAVAEWDPIRLRRSIGYVIQEGGLFPHFTVAGNVGLVPRLEGWSEDRRAARVDELLDAVGLAPAEFRSRYPRQLSGGQRQRVGVARALASDPPVLLFDEPFGALDPVTRAELQRQFAELAARLRKTSLFVTHDVREALLLGDRIALLAEGRLDCILPPAAFLAGTTSEARVFLESLQEIPR